MTFNMKEEIRNEKVILIIPLLIMLFVSLTVVIAQECDEAWQCKDWQKCYEGMAGRKCYDLNSCGTEIKKPAENTACKEALPYCYDKILNQDESDTDCGGGICEACALKKACLRTDDCKSELCINDKCVLEETKPGAPAPSFSSLLNLLIVGIISIIIVVIIVILIKKTKVQKMVEYKKSEFKIRKSGMQRLRANVKDYFTYSKTGSVQKEAVKEDKKKDLLNKKSSKVQEHPTVRRFMLDNIREVYHG